MKGESTIRSIATLLIVVFLSELILPITAYGAVSGGATPAKPEVNAQGMNMNAFGSVNGGAVDLASGAMSYSQTDVSIPGRNGMNLTVERSYNSKEFLASPKWSKAQSDAFYNYAGQDLKTLKWQVATPEQWSGWIGNGWKTNISGRLSYIKYNYYYYKADWWGARTLTKDWLRTEIIIVQTSDGHYSFQRDYKENKDGKEYEDSDYINCVRGDQAKMVRNVAGFILTLPDGRQFLFKENYFTTRFRINCMSETDLKSVHTTYQTDNTTTGEYLSLIEDSKGNQIHFEYEKKAPYVVPEHIEKLSPAIAGQSFNSPRQTYGAVLYISSLASHLEQFQFLSGVDVVGTELHKIVSSIMGRVKNTPASTPPASGSPPSSDNQPEQKNSGGDKPTLNLDVTRQYIQAYIIAVFYAMIFNEKGEIELSMSNLSKIDFGQLAAITAKSVAYNTVINGYLYGHPKAGQDFPERVLEEG